MHLDCDKYVLETIYDSMRDRGDIVKYMKKMKKLKNEYEKTYE